MCIKTLSTIDVFVHFKLYVNCSVLSLIHVKVLSSIHADICSSRSFVFHCYIIFHCVDIPQSQPVADVYLDGFFFLLLL